MVSDRSIVVLSKEQISVDLDKEAVILNMKSGVYFGMEIPCLPKIYSRLSISTETLLASTATRRCGCGLKRPAIV